MYVYYLVGSKNMTMDSDDQRKTRNNVLNNSNILKSIWIRYSSIQINAINKRLLDYNAYYVCVCAPILWFISIFL